MDDLISRQAAIEAIKEDKIDLTNTNVVAVFKATGDFEKVETQMMTCDRHIEILKDLPSAQLKSYRSYREGYQAGFKDAQSERKRGKWIAVTEDGDVYKRICSCCGQEAFFQNDDPDELYDGGRYELSDFCPHCGADMREVDDERPD